MGRMPKWIELLIRSKSCKIREEQITGVVKSVIIFIARSRNHVISWIHLSNLHVATHILWERTGHFGSGLGVKMTTNNDSPQEF